MTVAELISKLLELDQTLPVTVASYEFGFNDIDEISTITVEPAEKPSYIPADNLSNGKRRAVVCIGPKDPSLHLSR